MTSTTKAWALLALMILMSACRTNTPTMPSPVQPAVPGAVPGPPAATYYMSGLVVDEGGSPVARAVVTSDNSAVVTDGDGAYNLTLQLHGPIGAFVVAKPEYEISRHAVFLTADRTTFRNLRLQTIRRIAAGESVHLTIKPEDPQCTYEWIPCRRVRVRSSSSGTLRLQIIPDAPVSRFSLLLADEDLTLSSLSRLSLSVPVAAGAESMFDIISTTAGGFVLTTTLEP